VNFQAQPLQRHEREVMKADPEVVKRVIASYRLMLDFYGMQLLSEETGLLDRQSAPRNYAHRYRNLIRESCLRIQPCMPVLTSCPGSGHNYLRISRILKCLSEIGLERLNAGFLLHVLNEQSEHGELDTAAIHSSMDRWWANCLRDDAEREWVANVVGRVRERDGFVFTRELYERVLENRKATGKLAEG
jgi:hypothetical protein